MFKHMHMIFVLFFLPFLITSEPVISELNELVVNADETKKNIIREM